MKRAFILCLLVLGCRTQPLSSPVGGDDFGSPTDMAVPDLRGRDLANPGGRIGCNELNLCINECGSERCQRDCFQRGTNSAQDLYQVALECLFNWCFVADGNRPPRCVQGQGGQPRDRPDAGVGGCMRCLENAFAEISGGVCDPADPDCEPRECEPDVNACLAN